MNYHNKQILVLGLGRSGLAAARLLQQAGAIVTVIDSGSSEALEQRAKQLRAEDISIYLGKEALDLISTNYELRTTNCHCEAMVFQRAILSPGIDPASALVKHVVTHGIPLIGELELAYEFCKCPIVAITGTNGKTTTTELTVAGLQAAGLKAIACGNIGLPFSEVVLQSAELDVIIIEVSSFQLEATDRFHAHVAVWLNLSPNHLDRYASVAEYREAKLRVFRNQESDDVVVIPKNFDTEELPQFVARQITVSSQDEIADFFFDGKSICYHQRPLLELGQTQLCGAHNAENIMAAFAIGVALKVPPQKMIKGISEYRSLPHRCEVVIEKNGVLWINDSKSTTLDAKSDIPKFL